VTFFLQFPLFSFFILKYYLVSLPIFSIRNYGLSYGTYVDIAAVKLSRPMHDFAHVFLCC
jgi:hypothetical protein